jgi:microcystin degradation protein MlrC
MEVLRRTRQGLSPEFPIGASLDFHGNVSSKMTEFANILVGYQTYPHVDQRDRGLLTARLLAQAVRGEIKPVIAVAKLPLIINLLGQATEREPMRSLLTRARNAERQPGMLSVSIMAGFPYADVPEMGPGVIAVADSDRSLAQTTADELAHALWDVRQDLHIPCPGPEDAVRLALGCGQRPVVLVDLGDNIGGGSAGDGTILLAELLRQRASGAIVVLYSPEGVREAQAVNIGSAFTYAVGGVVDRLHGDPTQVQGIVRSLHEGRWVEVEPRHGGRRENDQGPTAVIEIDGPNTLVLNSLRTPPFSLGQLTSLGLDPSQASILVVKAAVAYKAAYAPIAGKVIEVDTPGLTAINPARFSYRHIRRPMFPLDQ